MKLYLASTSPRRRELLATLGHPFETIAPAFEERPTGRSAPEEALWFAEQKARSVAPLCPNALILASDTLIALGDAIFGKPADLQEAKRMLSALSGQTHDLYTAVALLNTSDSSLKKGIEQVRVTFKTLSEEEIQKYTDSGEPMGKAGAYAIQGMGAQLISKVEGDIQTVIGLPLQITGRFLKDVLFGPDPLP